MSLVEKTQWIGVDLDGTLAEYYGWTKWNEFGAPIVPMQKRVMRWLAEGRTVKIVTARVGLPIVRHGDKGDKRYINLMRTETCHKSGEKFSDYDMVLAIQAWTSRYLGVALDVQCYKDLHMIELWDDRAVQVIPNTGMPLGGRAEATAEEGKAWDNG
jgi:hypothetical protein